MCLQCFYSCSGVCSASIVALVSSVLLVALVSAVLLVALACVFSASSCSGVCSASSCSCFFNASSCSSVFSASIVALVSSVLLVALVSSFRIGVGVGGGGGIGLGIYPCTSQNVGWNVFKMDEGIEKSALETGLHYICGILMQFNWIPSTLPAFFAFNFFFFLDSTLAAICISMVLLYTIGLNI